MLTAGLLGACSAAPPEAALPAAPVGHAVPAAAAPALHPAAARGPAPRDLAGLSERELVTMLGAPDFRRVEPPAELWQYRSAQCVLDVFLYADKDGTRVVHSETRARNLEASAGRCAQRDDILGARTRESRL